MRTCSRKFAYGVSKVGGDGRRLLLGWPRGCGLMAPPSASTHSLDSLSENKIGDEGVEQLSATFPRLKALETLK